MIAYIEGDVIGFGKDHVIVKAGPLGYKVFVTKQDLGAAVGTIAFHTYLAVREDALDLYGFKDEATRTMFLLLITVSGIGPKTALNILNATTTEILRQSISQGETAHLTKISGIGKKVAEKIIVELRGKIDDAHTTNIEGDVEVIEALMSLGYTQKDARRSLEEIDDSIVGTALRVKAALKYLGK